MALRIHQGMQQTQTPRKVAALWREKRLRERMIEVSLANWAVIYWWRAGVKNLMSTRSQKRQRCDSSSIRCRGTLNPVRMVSYTIENISKAFIFGFLFV